MSNIVCTLKKRHFMSHIANACIYLTATTAIGVTQPPPEYVRAANQVKHGDLLLAMAYVESGYNMAAVGALGELGPLQLRPEYAPAVRTAKTILDHFRIASAYLTKLERSCAFLGDSWFVCYNLGPNKAKVLYANLVVDTARKNKYAVKVTEALRVFKKTKSDRWSAPQDKGSFCRPKNNSEGCPITKGRKHPRTLQPRRQSNLCKQGHV